MGKKFHLGDILSLTIEVLLSPTEMIGVRNILDYMIGEKLMTFSLVTASRLCAPYLLQKMPWLAEIKVDDVNQANYEDWMAEMVQKYGEFHEVEPLSEEAKKRTTPKSDAFVIDAKFIDE